MKTILLVVIMVAAVALIEFTSIAHPIERLALGATRQLRRAIQRSDPSDTARTEHIRALLQNEQIEELKKQLAYRERSEVRMLGASVSGYSTDPTRSLLLIDRGRHDGIKRGAPVIAGDGILIGSVYEVSEYASMVMPLYDPRSSILVRIPNEGDGIHGIAKGRFNVGVDLTYIPITEELRAGDIVVTSGLQEGIPAGLVIGTVQEIKKNPQDLFQSAVLDVPYADYPPLNVLVVITEQ